MAEKLSPEHEGSAVVTSDGKRVGRVQSVEGNTAHVKPEKNIDEATRRRLGWSDKSSDMYELDSDKVDEIDGDEIKLKD